MITCPTTSHRRVVYLLHFDRTPEAEAHYVGITTPSRLAERMREHCSGRAAARTARAVSEGVPWRLANLWTTDQAALEQHMIEVPTFWHYCPVCRGGPGLKRYNTTKKPPRHPVAASELLDLSSSLPGKAAPLLSHEKGSGPETRPPFLSFGQT